MKYKTEEVKESSIYLARDRMGALSNDELLTTNNTKPSKV